MEKKAETMGRKLVFKKLKFDSRKTRNFVVERIPWKRLTLIWWVNLIREPFHSLSPDIVTNLKPKSWTLVQSRDDGTSSCRE